MDGEAYGFVGVGRMGGPMSTRLLNDGRGLLVYDRSRAAVDALVNRGARGAPSAAEVASAADTVFLSLPTPDIVHAVALGPGGVIEGTRVKRVVDFELWRTGRPSRLRLRVLRGNEGLPQVVTVVRGHG